MKEPVAGSGLGWRHIQVLLIFLCMTTAMCVRTCLSVAIVVMTTHEFDWSPVEKSMVMGAFLWGYMVTQVVGGSLSARGHASRWFAGSVAVSGVINLTTPFLAQTGGWAAVCGGRVACGFAQGLIFPTSYTLLGRWAPPEERARAGSIVLAAQPMGSVVAMALSGVVSNAWGWEAIFYLFGVIAIVMSAIWLALSADHPDTHPRISKAERDFINNSIATVAGPSKRLPVPWRSIATSVPFWTLNIAHICYVWGYWVTLTTIPTYLSQVFKLDIMTNGVVSALPYVAMLIFSWIFGWIADFIASKDWISLSVNRKIFNTIGNWVPAALLVALALLGSASNEGAVALLTIAVGLISGVFSGSLINFVDLTPNFSGVAFGISNTLASIAAASAPFTESLFVDKANPLPGWQNVYFMTAGIYFVFNLIWLIGGTAEEQPWNNPDVPPTTIQVSGHSNPAFEKS